jgi:hypothetical protein
MANDHIQYWAINHRSNSSRDILKRWLKKCPVFVDHYIFRLEECTDAFKSDSCLNDAQLSMLKVTCTDENRTVLFIGLVFYESSRRLLNS